MEFKEMVLEALEKTMEEAQQKREELKKEFVEKTNSFYLAFGSISYHDLKREVEKLAREHGFDPEDAVIATEVDYDVFMPSEMIKVVWESKRRLTEEEIEERIEKWFSRRAFKNVFYKMINNGYRRVGVRSSKLFDFNPYRSFLENDEDTIVRYYSLYFKK